MVSPVFCALTYSRKASLLSVPVKADDKWDGFGGLTGPTARDTELAVAGGRSLLLAAMITAGTPMMFSYRRPVRRGTSTCTYPVVFVSPRFQERRVSRDFGIRGN